LLRASFLPNPPEGPGMRTFRLALTMFMAVAATEAAGQQTGLTHLGYLTCSLAVASDVQDANTPGPLRQTRDMLCAFKPSDEGPEETYFGTFHSISQDLRDVESAVMIWNVRGARSMLGTPGLLQQLYSIDAGAAPGRATPLVGETNSSVLLEAMTEDRDGQSNADQKPMASIMSIVVALRLRSTPT
jgi:Protein of unknown function (DUF992)